MAIVRKQQRSSRSDSLFRLFGFGRVLACAGEMTAPINGLTRRVIAAAIKIHRALGPGLLESAYLACMLFELHRQGLNVIARHPVPVIYDSVRINCGYELDLLVEDVVIVELKSVQALTKIHDAQLLTYLKLTGRPVGLLINFNEVRLVDGVRRLLNPAPHPQFVAAAEELPQR